MSHGTKLRLDLYNKSLATFFSWAMRGLFAVPNLAACQPLHHSHNAVFFMQPQQAETRFINAGKVLLQLDK